MPTVTAAVVALATAGIAAVLLPWRSLALRLKLLPLRLLLPLLILLLLARLILLPCLGLP